MSMRIRPIWTFSVGRHNLPHSLILIVHAKIFISIRCAEEQAYLSRTNLIAHYTRSVCHCDVSLMW